MPGYIHLEEDRRQQVVDSKKKTSEVRCFLF